jgi:hypothetical protein
VETVEIYVVGANGDETLCFRGGSVGRATTKPWLKPGLEFRLRNAESGDMLATALVQAGEPAMAESNTEPAPFRRSTGE